MIKSSYVLQLTRREDEPTAYPDRWREQMEPLSREELLVYLRRGMSSVAIAAELTAQTGKRVAPSTVRRWANNVGLSMRSYDPDSVIPEEWRPFAYEHRAKTPLERLRQVDARRRGEPLSEDPAEHESESAALDRWIASLRDAGEVIAYSRERGFYRVKRRPGDDELTRAEDSEDEDLQVSA